MMEISQSQRWREKFAECEQRLRSSERGTWLDAIYVRLYRFLLARYGSNRECSWQPAAGPMNTLLPDPFEPVPTKPRAIIRDSLQMVHTLAAMSHPVPASVEPPGPWILAGTYRQEEMAEYAHVVLVASDVAARLEKRHGRYELQVPRTEVTRAIDVLEENLNVLNDNPFVEGTGRPIIQWLLVEMFWMMLVVALGLAIMAALMGKLEFTL